MSNETFSSFNKKLYYNKKIYKEKLYYNRNRLQNTFCKMINDILNEDKLNKNNDSNFNNDSKNKTK